MIINKNEIKIMVFTLFKFPISKIVTKKYNENNGMMIIQNQYTAGIETIFCFFLTLKKLTTTNPKIWFMTNPLGNPLESGYIPLLLQPTFL